MFWNLQQPTVTCQGVDQRAEISLRGLPVRHTELKKRRQNLAKERRQPFSYQEWNLLNQFQLSSNLFQPSDVPTCSKHPVFWDLLSFAEMDSFRVEVHLAAEIMAQGPGAPAEPQWSPSLRSAKLPIAAPRPILGVNSSAVLMARIHKAEQLSPDLRAPVETYGNPATLCNHLGGHLL